jgi:hypothetical protein
VAIRLKPCLFVNSRSVRLVQEQLAKTLLCEPASFLLTAWALPAARHTSARCLRNPATLSPNHVLSEWRRVSNHEDIMRQVEALARS